MKFKDTTASKAGNGFIWKRGRDVYKRQVQGAWIDPGEGVIYIKYITKS